MYSDYDFFGLKTMIDTADFFTFQPLIANIDARRGSVLGMGTSYNLIKLNDLFV